MQYCHCGYQMLISPTCGSVSTYVLHVRFGMLTRANTMLIVCSIRAHRTTLPIAKAIDGDIQMKYHVQTGIEADWNARMKKILGKWRRLKEDIRRDIQCLGGNSPPSPGSPMDTSLWRKRNNKLQARFLSILDSAGEGFSALPLSALERRAGPARSGPKAAKCPTCPKKNQPPKKTVPRSKVQPKPKPAVKPRKPAKAPQPRKPSPTKKVTPRPAVNEICPRFNSGLLTNRHADTLAPRSWKF